MHRLFIIDQDRKLHGVLSIKDILQYIVFASSYREDQVRRMSASERRASFEEEEEKKDAERKANLFSKPAEEFGFPRDVIETEASVPLYEALNILVQSNLNSLPVYNSESRCYEGFLDTRDLMSFILYVHDIIKKNGETCDDLEFEKLQERIKMREAIETDVGSVVDLSRNNPFYMIPTGTSMLLVVTLLAEGVHRVPIIDPETRKVVRVISQSDVIRFLNRNSSQLGSKMDCAISETNLCPKEVVSVPKTMELLEVIRVMVTNSISAVPVVDDDGKLLTVISATDVRMMCSTLGGHVNVDAHTPVLTWIQDVRRAEYEHWRSSRRIVLGTPVPWFQPDPILIVCSPTDTIRSVLTKLSTSHVHRLYVVDDAQKPISVISLKVRRGRKSFSGYCYHNL